MGAKNSSARSRTTAQVLRLQPETYQIRPAAPAAQLLAKPRASRRESLMAQLHHYPQHTFSQKKDWKFYHHRCPAPTLAVAAQH